MMLGVRCIILLSFYCGYSPYGLKGGNLSLFPHVGIIITGCGVGGISALTRPSPFTVRCNVRSREGRAPPICEDIHKTGQNIYSRGNTEAGACDSDTWNG